MAARRRERLHLMGVGGNLEVTFMVGVEQWIETHQQETMGQ